MPPSVQAGVLDPAPAAPLEFRDPLDYKGTRNAVFGSVQNAFSTAFPIDNGVHKLEIKDVGYVDPDWYSPEEEKKAILERRSLTRRLRGTVTLSDSKTGEVIDTAKKTLLHVPYLTDRGTYIKNGSDYTVASQMRLLSGTYARTKDNGEREVHFNVLDGGPPFRVSMDSDTGVYRMFLGGSKLKLYPILRAAGVSDEAMQERWGKDLFEINRAADDGTVSAKKAAEKLASRKEKEANAIPALTDLLRRIRLDSRVTRRTMDKPYENADPEALLSATAKILKMAKGEAEDDDRDAMAFQETYGPEDLFEERVRKDAGHLAKKMLSKVGAQRSLKSVGSGALDNYMDQVFYRSGMGAALEEINPLDAADQNLRLLRIGEGAIENEDAIPAAARAVQPSQFLYVDPIRAPESLKIGVDTRMTLGVRRGTDKRMYTPVVDAKTGKTVYKNPDELADSAVVFPQEMEQAKRDGRKRVIAIRGGKTVYVKPEEADYFAPSVSSMFTANSLLIPAVGSIKGGRLLMAAKYLNQALPIENPDAPLVLSRTDDGAAYEDRLSHLVGAHRAKEGGKVVSVDGGVVRLKTPSGKEEAYTYYENFPHNRKSRLHSTPMVKIGDAVAPGQAVTRSNYTDQTGRIAMGKNLTVAFLVEPNSNHEDGMAISESAAKKMRSEHLYTESLDQDRQTQVNAAKFLGLFPGAFKKEQLGLLDAEGVVKVGQKVEYGDPLMLSVSRRDPKGMGMMSRSAKSAFSDASVKWTHKSPGIVTDVYRDKDGVKVAVLSYSNAEKADKLVNRFAAKGVISSIIPDELMPKDANGRPFDIVQNPQGILTRINPAQATAELLLSKIAAKTGKPYTLEPMTDDNLVDYVREELRKNKVEAEEEVWDPQTKRKLKVFNGVMHMTKLHHTAESKVGGRAVGSYTADGEPARGLGQEDTKPKRMGFGEMAALISHGAVNTIRDARVIRGQRNDEYFRQLMLGNRPPEPGMPNSYKKFRAMLSAAGIRVRKEEDGAERLMAMTDKDVDAISAGEIKRPDTVKWTTSFDRTAMGGKDLDPVDGGLFDRGITGGHGGNRFAHIKLSEPFPQPVMEPTIKTLLGLTGPQFDAVVAGKEPVSKFGTGGTGIRNALAAIDVERELNLQKTLFRSTTGAKRDLAAKKIRALTALQDTGVKPADLVVTKIAVLPPIFRPVSSTAKFDLVSGTNQLYQYLMHSDQNMRELKEVGGEAEQDARATTYKMMRALVGLDAPPMKRLQEQNVRGILADVTGTSPKFGTFQKKLMGAVVDMSGRGVILGDAGMGMDELGIPEAIAWPVFMPYTMNRLVRDFGGGPEAKARAMREYADKTERAKRAMLDEMEVRPVLSSRAPALHRYSIMAFRPKLVTGDAIHIGPYNLPGLGADFDGDAMNVYAPASPEAVQEAYERLLPSKNLISPADFGPVIMPRQEYLEGLWRATAKKPKEGAPKYFNTVQDLQRAFAAGEVDLDDPVRVLDLKSS